MSDSPATKQDIKRMNLRMVRLQDDFRSLEDLVKVISRVLERHSKALRDDPSSEE